ncbi:uncharacterized protein [Embiotoca jacksoni]|uniref:uncharacterized protein n=1 Tax=Embiotoca jacksoni TaxID=100190 RepID=UPI003703A788
MDDLRVKHPDPFNQNGIMSLKTLDFYLQLLLLLYNVIHNQSLRQHCLIRTEVGGFPNFTAEAGSSFFFRLPTPTNQGHVKQYQLSLAAGDGILPRWMAFERQTSSLAGLALAEECGIFHLKVSVTGKKCTAHFYLHILNVTVTNKDPVWDTLSCSEGETTIWANLLLQVNPVTLDASHRIRLVSTMADYLHLLLSFVSLFTQRKSLLLREKLRVCGQGRLAEKQDAIGDVAELLWPVGCLEEERQIDLAEVLKHSMKAGSLANLLGAPIVGWRVLCAAGEVQHKVKRHLQMQKSTPTPDMVVPPPTQVQQSMKLSHIHALPLKLEPNYIQNIPSASLYTVEQTDLYPYSTGTKRQAFSDGHLKWLSVHNSQQQTKRTGRPASETKPPLEVTGCIEEVTFWTTELSPSPFLPEHLPTVGHSGHTASDIDSCYTKVLSTLRPSCRPHSNYPSPPPTPASHGVTSTLTREAVDGDSLAICLTSRRRQKENPVWSESLTASHTDSERHSALSSWGHSVDNQEPTKDHNSATEIHNDVLLPSSASKTIQSLPSSNKIPSTQLFSDVSPSLMWEQLSGTQRSDAIQRLSAAPSGMSRDVMSQLNVTNQDVSSAALMGQLKVSGQTDLEASLSPTFLNGLEPSVTTLTPALPSKLAVFSGQHETLDVTNSVFTVQSLQVSSFMIQRQQTFSTTSFPDIIASSLQQKLEGLNSSTEVCLNQNGQTQTSNLEIESVSILPTHLSWALSINPCSSNPPQIVSGPTMFKELSVTEKLPFKSSSGNSQVKPSLEQSLIQTQQLQMFSHISSVAKKTTCLDMTLLTVIPPVLKTGVTEPLSVFWTTTAVFEGHCDPTAPSTVQKPHGASSSQQILSLEPSFPLCGISVAQSVSGCAPLIKSTTMEHALNFLTRFSHDNKYPTDFNTSVTFDPSRQFFSAETLVESLSSRNTNLPSGHVLEEHTPRKPTQLVSTENLQTRMSTSLPTSLQAEGLSSYRRQSSVQPPRPSASISSSLNLPPKVLQSIPTLTATVGFPFHFSVPPKTFVNPEDGEAPALSLEMQLIEGPPVSVGTWLALDGLELHGVPLELDLQFAPQDLLLVAWDTRGLSTRLPLTLDLHQSPLDPCHVFTLTARRSLYSILRHRHRVELLLRKLSSFFNSSISHHLAVVSMTPGSTVVSWYNYSLCETGQTRTTQCHVDQVRSMWSAMSSAGGSVNPAFREAMLPEFTITKVGSVRFRRDCYPTPSSSTPALHTPLNPDVGTNTSLSPASPSRVSTSPAGAAMDSYQWMAGMLTALLVVCLLILIVLLVAAVLYFCRGHGRSRTVAIWPAGRVLSVRSRDLTAIRPRRPPRLQPELPPPPLRLWISLSHDDDWKPPADYKRERKTLDKTLQPRPLQ